ncbi:ABC transporter ATP-binding protein [Bacillus sp. AFS055030]|uniref:ABC transporter ATP-binding protein n=1 Tax=Bacillus sp. AFS055030 TaxID=2033507 RepID=UPI000BFC0233|nr:ABC transporter ATP-binding protein [Bacillus sp. AFS055030]PGL71015.1 bacitracin ABC transporter ATP-binding protein [Bacillus sp. AFS055030]
MEMLKVSHLSKNYGKEVISHAIKHISFSIEPGEFVGVMGPSGSGKTTLLNLISTVDQPTTGEIQIKGINTKQLNSDDLALFRRRELGFVFQDFNLLDTLTIAENVVLPLTLDNISVLEQESKLYSIAKTLRIDHLLDKRTYEVSGGEAQRTAIARAIIHNPSLLLADEPTGNLDSRSARTVMELFEKVNKEQKLTTIMVTHDPVAASYCERIIFIKDGLIYNEIHSGGSRLQFYQQVIDVLSLLGGDPYGF